MSLGMRSAVKKKPTKIVGKILLNLRKSRQKKSRKQSGKQSTKRRFELEISTALIGLRAFAILVS